MKKEIIATLLLATMLCGCGTAYTDPKGEIPQEEETNYVDEIVEKDLTEVENFTPFADGNTAKGTNNYSFTLDNVEYSFPFKLTDMEDNGWVVGESFDMTEEVQPGEYAGLIAYKDGCEVTLSVMNKGSEVITVAECNVAEVRCVQYPWNEEYLQFKSPDGFTFGDTKDTVAAGFEYNEDEAINDPESSMYTMTRREYANINGYDYFIGEISYVFEDDYLAQIVIEYKGE